MAEDIDEGDRHNTQKKTQPASPARNGGDEDVKSVVAVLSELRYLMMTDKALTALPDKHDDVHVWNDALSTLMQQEGEAVVTWFQSPWLFAECFLYRRIAGAFFCSRHLRSFDPFQFQKETAFVSSMPFMKVLGDNLLTLIAGHAQFDAAQRKDTILNLIQISLWGNKCDLSLSGGDNHEQTTSCPLAQVNDLRDFILVSDLDAVYDLLQHLPGERRVDIVLDNAGLELFGDLCLAEFLLDANVATKVVFHGKAMPWFVSDISSSDFAWTMELLRSSQENSLNVFGHKWHERMERDEFIFQAHPFWTYPFAYCDMEAHAPDLLANLSRSSLIIFKGDLNYRKLVGDRDWPLDTPFKQALCQFTPAPLLALRTLKAETVAGLGTEAIASLKKKFPSSKEWMVSGEYAVIQLCNVSTSD